MCESTEYVTMYSYCARIKVKNAKEEFYLGTVFVQDTNSIEEARRELLQILEDTTMIKEDQLEYIYIIPGTIILNPQVTRKIKKD